MISGTGLLQRSPVLVLVGPGRHFGREIIERFSGAGFTVVAIASTLQSLAELREGLGLLQDIHLVQGDVRNVDHFSQTLAEIGSRLGGIDCLIYNPKVSVKGTGLKTTPDELSSSLQVNVVGAVVAIQVALPYLLQTSRPTVILTGGGYKDSSDPDKFALSVGKSALHAVARAIEKPLRQRGVDLKTVIIRKAVRPNDPRWSSATDLAEFFWQVYAHGRTSVFYYPPKSYSASGQLQLLTG